MFNKIIFKVPKGIQFISEWKEYQIPKGHCIVDKGVTGCGYTEFCLTNELPVILCSPRRLLLENKLEQHALDLNLLYPKNDIGIFSDVVEFMESIKSHINKCFYAYNKPPKILITYDSAHYVKRAITEMGLLDRFYFIVDEFQSIFLDSFFKSDVEFDFVEELKTCPNVLYLSATPMLDKYLIKIDNFKNLPFYRIDWSDTGFVENIIIQRKQTRSLSKECKDIIKKYKSGKYPMTITENNKLVISTEAIFYFNSITEIIRIISKMKLTPDEVNIISANTEENQLKLDNLSRDLGYNSKKNDGFKIGKIPLKGEINKMFTFCTKTAYIGSDFYSNCASSFVFADPNINSLALDISLDLPQIVGRQRNKSNPFKNSIVVYYKTIRKNEITTREEFEYAQEDKRNTTEILIGEFSNMSDKGKQKYVQKLRSDIKLSQYSNDFVSISRITGMPVYNKFIELANERAWEVSQRDYQDKISVTKALESVSPKVSEYKSDIEKEIDDFLDNHFYKTGIFHKKMKMYCEFMDKHKGSQEVSDSIYFRIKDDRFRKYYNFYGTSGCSARNYQEGNLYKGLVDVSKDSELSTVIYKRFKVGEKYTLKEIKSILQNIYRDLGIINKPKATDLNKYFKLKRTSMYTPDKKIKEVFKLEPLQ